MNWMLPRYYFDVADDDVADKNDGVDDGWGGDDDGVLVIIYKWLNGWNNSLGKLCKNHWITWSLFGLTFICLVCVLCSFQLFLK